MEGESHLAVMLTRPGPAPAILVQGEGCGVRLLVVGGGGRGGDYAGGGSGHLEYRSLQVSPGTLLTGQVGDRGQASSLAISSGDTVTAGAGREGRECNGGAGYSGGGGCGGNDLAGDGGTDGGDGEEGTFGGGGAGTGADLASYTLATWSLAPGRGGAGEYYDVYDSGAGGGGGGGVLVDGAGPWAGEEQGAGWGGGGGYRDHGDGLGLPGLILIEIRDK